MFFRKSKTDTPSLCISTYIDIDTSCGLNIKIYSLALKTGKKEMKRKLIGVMA